MKRWKFDRLRGPRGLASATLLGMITLAFASGPATQMGQGRMRQGGPGNDMADIHRLFAARAKISRTVKLIPDGMVTVTESKDPEVAEILWTHVQAMKRRLEQGRPIHARDPFFARLFQNHRHIHMKLDRTKTGVKVTETSKDPYTVKLIQKHGGLVNAFIENGMAEMHRRHEPPPP